MTAIGKTEGNSGEQGVGYHEINLNMISLRGPLDIQVETWNRQLEFEERCRLKMNIWELSAYRWYLKLGNGWNHLGSEYKLRTGEKTEPQGLARPKSEAENGTRHWKEAKIEVEGKSGECRVLEANKVFQEGWSAHLCQMPLRWGLKWSLIDHWKW